MQSTRASLQRLKKKKAKSVAIILSRKMELYIEWLKMIKLLGMRANQNGKIKNNLNKYSLGIEIQNKGHQFGYEKFTKKQINALIQLLKILVKKYKIKKIIFSGIQILPH